MYSKNYELRMCYYASDKRCVKNAPKSFGGLAGVVYSASPDTLARFKGGQGKDERQGEGKGMERKKGGSGGMDERAGMGGG